MAGGQDLGDPITRHNNQIQKGQSLALHVQNLWDPDVTEKCDQKGAKMAQTNQ